MDTVKEAFKYAEETLKQGIKRLSVIKKKENNAGEIDNVCNKTHMSSAELSDKLELANKINSPLLRLPGELRNMIYEYIAPTFTGKIVVKERNLGQHPRTYKGVKFIISSSRFRNLLEVSRQLRCELWSYALDDNRSNIDWWHLEGLVQHFENYGQHKAAHMSYHIKSLVIDVTDRVTEGIESDAEFLAKCLRPLCKNGRLQNIELQSRRRFDIQANERYMRPNMVLEALQSKLDFESVGKAVFIEVWMPYNPKIRWI